MDKKRNNLIKELKKFKKQNRIRTMYLFGSRAAGKIHKWSDVDLIVVSKRFRNKKITARAVPLYMKWNLNYPVDFLCYSPEEFNKFKKQTSIISEAVKNGIEI